MNLESPKISLTKSANEVFDFLSNVNNFEELMPENISNYELLEKDKFIFAITGMPEIILQKKSEEAPISIVLGAAGGKLDFTLKAKITSIEANKTEVQLSFTGNFNPMMAMMIKGPISKFIETLVTNIPKSIQYSI